MKIDIEGGEWRILGDPRLADTEIRVLTVEIHGTLRPVQNYREHAVELLERAGFSVRETHWDGSVGQLWAWRPDAAA